MLVRLRASGGGSSWLTPKLPGMYLDRHLNLNARLLGMDVGYHQHHDDEVTDGVGIAVHVFLICNARVFHVDMEAKFDGKLWLSPGNPDLRIMIEHCIRDSQTNHKIHQKKQDPCPKYTTSIMQPSTVQLFSLPIQNTLLQTARMHCVDKVHTCKENLEPVSRKSNRCIFRNK